MAGPITVLIVSDEGDAVAQLAQKLGEEPGFVIAGECSASVEQLSSAVERLRPGVLLWWTRRPVELTMLRERHSRLPAILIGDLVDDEVVEQLLHGGAEGYWEAKQLLELDLGLLVKAIRGVSAGQLWWSRLILEQAVRRLAPHYRDASWVNHQSGVDQARVKIVLTRREARVGALVVSGLSNKEIARKLGITENTVKKHLKSLFGKFAVHRRGQLVRCLNGRVNPGG